MRILFTYLAAFANTGGIQKFNRAFMKAGTEIWGEDFHARSAHDTRVDTEFMAAERFEGFNYKRLPFMWASFKAARKSDILVIGHIKLAPLGLLLSLLFPRKKSVLIVHGIEVWRPLNKIALRFLNRVGEIWSVSDFTRQDMVQRHGIDADRIRIFTNTLDPFFSIPQSFGKPEYLQERYGLGPENKVIFSLARLSSTEKFKGYDQVIQGLPKLLEKNPHLRFVLGGKADATEKARLEAMMQENGVENEVMLAGFIPDEEIVDHYLLADVFTLPSKKEGFGIVFIEAMACGVPVIAGNKDGSVEALRHGELGTLIDPDNLEELVEALHHQLNDSPVEEEQRAYAIQRAVIKYFGFDAFKNSLLIRLNAL
ncbi:MAG: glycosyltransferase family 4 protein [Bacteroidota bacterium]